MSSSRQITIGGAESITSPNPDDYFKTDLDMIQAEKIVAFRNLFEARRRNESHPGHISGAHHLPQAMPVELRAESLSYLDITDMASLALAYPDTRTEIEGLLRSSHCHTNPNLSTCVNSRDYGEMGQGFAAYDCKGQGEELRWCQALTYVLDLTKDFRQPVDWPEAGYTEFDRPVRESVLKALHTVIKCNPVKGTVPSVALGQLVKKITDSLPWSVILPFCSFRVEDGADALLGFRRGLEILTDSVDTVLFEEDADAPFKKYRDLELKSLKSAGILDSGPRHAVLKLRNSTTSGFGVDEMSQKRFARSVAALTTWANQRGTHITIVNSDRWDTATIEQFQNSVNQYIGIIKQQAGTESAYHSTVTSLGFMTPEEAETHDFSREKWGLHPDALTC